MKPRRHSLKERLPAPGTPVNPVILIREIPLLIAIYRKCKTLMEVVPYCLIRERLLPLQQVDITPLLKPLEVRWLAHDDLVAIGDSAERRGEGSPEEPVPSSARWAPLSRPPAPGRACGVHMVQFERMPFVEKGIFSSESRRSLPF